jgi:hypothetical protein
VDFETYSADGAISYWNAYVGVGQMGGHGSFTDPRVGISISQTPDLVTPKLADLLAYELSLRVPDAPANIDVAAATRGAHLFRGAAGCATCHRQPNYTDVLRLPGHGTPFLHAPEETGMDPRYAERTATGKYRTTPLRGLAYQRRFFHDGTASTLAAVVSHYDLFFGLNLTPAEQADLVEFLKSL